MQNKNYKHSKTFAVWENHEVAAFRSCFYFVCFIIASFIFVGENYCLSDIQTYVYMYVMYKRI